MLMSLSGFIVFIAAYIMAVSLPGPGVTAVIARVLGNGTRGVPTFISGFVVGELILLGIAATGLAVIIHTFSILFVIIKYSAAAYLLYMAFKLLTAPAVGIKVIPDNVPESHGRLFSAGLAITMGNPKVIVFFMALLPSVVQLDKLSLAGFSEIAGIIIVILSLVLGLYALLASRARLLFTSARAVQWLNWCTAFIMTSVAGVIAFRQ